MPPNNLTSKSVRYEGTNSEEAFDELKKILTKIHIQALPTDTKGFILYSDASRNGLLHVLMQDG